MSGGAASITAPIQGFFANKSRQAAGQGYNQAGDQLNASQNQALGYLNPYREAGQSALSPLTGLLTGNQYDPTTGQSTALSPEQRDNLLYQSPGYKFSVQQGQQGIERSQAARGGLLSGGAEKELSQYLSGVSSQYSDNYINQLYQLVGIGQSAASNSANVVQGFGSDLASVKANEGLVKANYYNQLGNLTGGVGKGFASDFGAAQKNAGLLQPGTSGAGAVVPPVV